MVKDYDNLTRENEIRYLNNKYKHLGYQQRRTLNHRSINRIVDAMIEENTLNTLNRRNIIKTINTWALQL